MYSMIRTSPSLPAVFQPRVAAVLLYSRNLQLDQTYPVGIRIGDIEPARSDRPYNIGTSNFLTYQVAAPVGVLYLPPPPTINPNTLIFRRVSPNPTRNGESLLPIVVYRQQVANAEFPARLGQLDAGHAVARSNWPTASPRPPVSGLHRHHLRPPHRRRLGIPS